MVPGCATRIEIASILRLHTVLEDMSATDAVEGIGVYVALPLVRHAGLPFLRRFFFLREDFCAYDAAYVALAEQRDAPLLTTDRRLSQAIRRHLPSLRLLT